MRKFWMFLAVGAFAFGLLTSQAEAKDLNKIDNMDKLDQVEAMDKQLGVHVDLPANVGAGATGIQGLQNNRALNPGAGLQNRTIQDRAVTPGVRAVPNRPATQAPAPDAPFSNFPHAPGADHG
jgi:hypothetical protein